MTARHEPWVQEVAMEWMVVKIDLGKVSVFGPLVAETSYDACDAVARGTARSVILHRAQGRGKYYAVTLDGWRDGAYEFDEDLGTTPLFSGV